jgi:hypothetical protein
VLMLTTVYIMSLMVVMTCADAAVSVLVLHHVGRLLVERNSRNRGPLIVQLLQGQAEALCSAEALAVALPTLNTMPE